MFGRLWEPDIPQTRRKPGGYPASTWITTFVVLLLLFRTTLLSWTGRIVAFRRDSTERGMTVLLDTGEDRLVTLLFRDFVRDSLSVKPPQRESEDEAVPPLLAELPQQDRDRVMQIYGDVLQVDTGSRRGTPEQDRAAGRLDPRFDPLRTSVEERIEAMVAVRMVRGTGGASRATLHRQRKAVRERGVSGLIHGNSKIHRNVLAEHDPAVLDCVIEFLHLHKREARISTRKLVVRVAAELASRGLGTDLSRRQVQQLVGEASRGLGLHGNAASRRTHSKKPLHVHGRHEVSAPGEMIQIDGTPTRSTSTSTAWVGSTPSSSVPSTATTKLAVRRYSAYNSALGPLPTDDVSKVREAVARAHFENEHASLAGQRAVVIDGPPLVSKTHAALGVAFRETRAVWDGLDDAFRPHDGAPA